MRHVQTESTKLRGCMDMWVAWVRGLRGSK